MALYTVLSSEQIAAAVRSFGLPAPDRVQPEPKGSVNTNYHLWAGGERWFLRLNEGKTDADVRFEAEVQRYLHEARFPVARLRLAADGRPWVPVDGKQAMLFAYAAGEEISRDAAGPERCRRVGEQLGRLHELASGFVPERRNPYAPERVRGWISELRPDGGGDADVRAALPMLEEELARAERLPGAPRGLVHGDLFIDNVLWIGDRVGAVLDWEMSCVDPFAYDLGVAVNAWCYVDRYDPARAAALLAGYRAKRRLEPETADALYPWARYAALRFTASRIHAFHRAALGADRLAWKDWRRYRDRLAALRDMGEGGFRALLGV
ncbi:Homoserine kinase [Anaeromyxobacter dehalogenans 2CP-1]|uniref:Homoserine kinase n=1 Tax=Anaeromyxobacter dehalogenans (strain ATCC BAA-258 / DSM 21875 / 2CP-1) TaxID=455488 RepID=B8J5E4_ANAD2|nr:homoserine kinase [Anaeromyxobacter dehalogenans]ACL66806.1 Homoserine kinase [Anaeromyxobacter dehalogenans 2CP-1]